MGLNDLINWYQSHGALNLGFKVLWSKNEGTDEVLEGIAQEYESTAGANLRTAEVNESTAEKIKVPLVFVKVPLVLSDILERTACFIRYRVIHEFWFLDGFGSRMLRLRGS
ncbi:hypothetical protein Tco_1450428 [Tanacetum coccineum]